MDDIVFITEYEVIPRGQLVAQLQIAMGKVLTEPEIELCIKTLGYKQMAKGWYEKLYTKGE